MPQPRVGAVVGPAAPRRPATFELKGTMAPLTVLRLKSTDLALVDRQLRVKIAQLPHLFLHAPILLDFSELEEAGPNTIPDVIRLVRGCKLVPVAATNVPEPMKALIAEAGLGILRTPPAAKPRPADPDATPLPEQPRKAVPPAPVPVPKPYGGPMVVTQAVRGGQIIYAANNDLVVLAPVNPGAQVIADGHVHIYSTLRGRAVAGAQGLPGARIFCQKLEAELVAISGSYVMAEEIPSKLRGKAVHISLENGACRLSPL